VTRSGDSISAGIRRRPGLWATAGALLAVVLAALFYLALK